MVSSLSQIQDLLLGMNFFYPFQKDWGGIKEEAEEAVSEVSEQKRAPNKKAQHLSALWMAKKPPSVDVYRMFHYMRTILANLKSLRKRLFQTSSCYVKIHDFCSPFKLRFALAHILYLYNLLHILPAIGKLKFARFCHKARHRLFIVANGSCHL